TIAVSADGTTLVTAGEANVIFPFEVVRTLNAFALHAKPHPYAGHTQPIFTLAVSPDGSQVASGAKDRTASFWSVYPGASTSSLQPSNGTIRSIAYSPDGRTLADVGWWSLDLWDVASHARIRSMPLHFGANSLLFISDDRLIVADEKKGLNSLRVWET